jgi:hypothetical protein
MRSRLWTRTVAYVLLMRSCLWTRTDAYVFLMRSRLWTRTVAYVLLLCLFLLTATLTIMGIMVKSPSVVTSIVLALIPLATATIALFMPLSSKAEARRKMQVAMDQYVVLQSLNAESSYKNRVINRMREQAPGARFRQEEIAEYLESTDIGERFAGLACVQWQWQKRKVHEVMDFGRIKNENPRELPEPPGHPSKGYFSQLLKVLCRSWDRFENYHATVAMWSMVDSLVPKDKQELFKRVLDQSAGPLPNTCEEAKWKKFIEHLNDERKSLTSGNG